MTRRALIVAARRTPVVPRGGRLCHMQADELAAPVLKQLMLDAGLEGTAVNQVILGNALYAGGNPARLAALRAGLPETVPALTVDTQCCAGLDAMILGARLIEAGAAGIVLAGGTESFSRAPFRMHRPLDKNAGPIPFHRPAFAPPPYADPDLAEAAADLAARTGTSRADQATFAVRSHEKARAAAQFLADRLVIPPDCGLTGDSFTRRLSQRVALKAPVIAGDPQTGLSAATIACEADGAAAALLMSEQMAEALGKTGPVMTAAASRGGDPAEPALVPIGLAQDLLKMAPPGPAGLTALEIHEAYAVQAMATIGALEVPDNQVNVLGGGLSRGHPIGASGAILICQLFEAARLRETVGKDARFEGMALIAAAGGLAAGVRLSESPV